MPIRRGRKALGRGQSKKGRYSPVAPRLGVSSIVAPTLPPRAEGRRRTTVGLPSVPIDVRLGLSIAAGWWWGAVAIIRVAAAGRGRVVVHGRATTRRWGAIAVLARVIVVATARRGATTVVITAGAVSAGWSTTVVVVILGRATVATSTIARRAGTEARLARAWNIRLGLHQSASACLLIVP